MTHIVLLSSRRPSIADPMEIPLAHAFMPFFCNATHSDGVDKLCSQKWLLINQGGVGRGAGPLQADMLPQCTPVLG